MAGKETASRRRKSLLLQQERQLGFRTDRPFLFQVDGGNIPRLRKGESSKSFLKRIKDWENFTGREYPRSQKLNRIRLRGTGGKKDYTGSDWEDEKKEWVSDYTAAKKADTQQDEDIFKEEFLMNPVAYEGTPTPINQAELDRNAELRERKQKLQIEKQDTTKEGELPNDNSGGVSDTTSSLGADNNALIAMAVPTKKVVKEPWKNKGGFTPDSWALKRATGVDINNARGLRQWQKLVNSNRVFDTTEKFGDKGGFFVTDNRGIPRFVKHKGG